MKTTLIEMWWLEGCFRLGAYDVAVSEWNMDADGLTVLRLNMMPPLNFSGIDFDDRVYFSFETSWIFFN